MSLSTLNSLLTTQYLRRGDGIIAMPASRRAERVFGANGSGRSRCSSAGVKLESVGADYNPKLDTCIQAFVRLLAAQMPAAETGG